MFRIVIPVLLFSLLISCNNSVNEEEKIGPIEAKYVLPFPVGKSYYCSQGFNTSYSHQGTFKYSVDFGMPIGTLITAARAGRVVYLVENFPDEYAIGNENVVIVMHEDSTFARYSHLTTNGALVTLNQSVIAGDTIGLSGNSGQSSHPHLHFDVTKTFSGRSDMTIPFDFINASPRPVGFNAGRFYEALEL